MYKLNRVQKKGKNIVWRRFMADTLMLDDIEGKANGWHWFWGLHYLYNLDLATIYDNVPDEHWFKEVDDSSHNLEKIYNDCEKAGLSTATGNLSDEFEHLEDTIYFYDVLFKYPIDYSTFIFPTNISFEETKFHADANFSKALFLGDARFSGVHFLETADFTNAIFCGKTAKFRNVHFYKIADFTDTTFKGYANFKGSEIKGRTTFQRAKFELHAPRFYNAEFNDEMTFSGMIPPKFGIDENDRLNEKSYKSNDAKETAKRYRKRIEENQNSYENTSTKLAEKNKYHDAHFFFRQEMRCRRQLINYLDMKKLAHYLTWRETGKYFTPKQIEKYLIISFYWLYEKLADYGYGTGRAFTAWFAHICFWAVVLMFVNYQKTSMVTNPFWCSILTSLVNAHNFFLAKGGGLESCYGKKLPLELNLIWGVETILGILFLFLLLLTLRVRFRLNNQ